MGVMSQYIESVERVPDRIVRLEDLEEGDFFECLEEDGLGVVATEHPFVYQRIDWSCGRSLGADSVEAGRPEETIVYNLTGAYIVQLDLNQAVRRFGRVKLVELAPESEASA